MNGNLLSIWARHSHVLPRFDTWMHQRQNFGAWHCSCGRLFQSKEQWRAETVLIEKFNLFAGGREWEQRRCKCGAARSLPVGEHNAKSRNL